MRIVITGATGFIGKKLTETLLGGGHKIVALSRNPEHAQRILPVDVTVASWDPSRIADITHYIDGADAVINLAGESVFGLWTELKKQKLVQSRIEITTAIAEAVKHAHCKPQVVIQGSAIGIYGHSTDAVLDESSPPGEGFLAELSKQWEAAIDPVEAMGVRVVKIRTGIVLGKGGGMLPAMVKAFKFFMGGYFGSGLQWMSWISINDEVDAIIYLLENQSCQGPYNLTAPEPVRMKQFCELIGKKLNRPVLFSVPRGAVRILATDMADDMLFSGQRVVPKKLLEAGFVFSDPHIDPAIDHLLH